MRVLLYKCPGPHAGTPVDGKGTSYDARGFEPEDVAARKAEGWYETLTEATERFVRGAAPAKPLAPAPVVAPAAAVDVPAEPDAPLILEPWAARAAVSDLRAL